MRITSAHLENFGSYKTLDINFDNQGLTLIQGPNGAGKSTIFDAIPWILFGVTAKGGKIDEIISWNTGGCTSGYIRFNDGLCVTRSRRPNDVYYVRCRDESSPQIRGKDLVDTQSKLSKELGIDADLYLSGAYYHEFSQTAQFFTTSAKARRELCEQVVDLSLAIKLQDRTQSSLKDIDQELAYIEQKIREEQGKIEIFQRLQIQETKKVQKWREDHERQIKQTREAHDGFEKVRRRVIKSQCRTCGTTLAAPKEVYDDSVNPYEARLGELSRAACPFDSTVKSYDDEINKARQNTEDYDMVLSERRLHRAQLEILQQAVKEFRGILVSNAIAYITSQTNRMLTEFFDGEIQVDLRIEGADKLEVQISKDGHNAVYTQLSKGQRQLLKLCFSVAVMKAVSNHHGVKFHQLFFDESMDGLSDMMKVKAFRLFQALRQEYDNIFVIDHSEALKSCFDNIINVSIDNGNSTLHAIA